MSEVEEVVVFSAGHATEASTRAGVREAVIAQLIDLTYWLIKS